MCPPCVFVEALTQFLSIILLSKNDNNIFLMVSSQEPLKLLSFRYGAFGPGRLIFTNPRSRRVRHSKYFSCLLILERIMEETRDAKGLEDAP